MVLLSFNLGTFVSTSGNGMDLSEEAANTQNQEETDTYTAYASQEGAQH